MPTREPWRARWKAGGRLNSLVRDRMLQAVWRLAILAVTGVEQVTIVSSVLVGDFFTGLFTRAARGQRGDMLSYN